MIAINYRVARQSFFDSKKVRKAMSRAKRRALSRAGAFVRRRARSSLRRSKKSSQPGDPPRVHVKGPSLKSILFYYDTNSEATIVGPIKFNAKQTNVRPARGTVPGLLEHGGIALVRERSGGRWRERRVKVEPRPFMVPALEKESPNFPKLFRDQMR